jgi:hypothetical protein
MIWNNGALENLPTQEERYYATIQFQPDLVENYP